MSYFAQKYFIEITKELILSIEIPELITERAVYFEKKYKISEQHAREIIGKNIPFDYYAEKYCIEPKLIAHILIETPKEVKARFNIDKEASKENFEFVFENLEKKKINKEAVIEVLKEILEYGKVDLNRYTIVNLGELEEDIKKIVSENLGVSVGGLMGDIMKKYKGKVEGKLVMKLLAKHRK